MLCKLALRNLKRQTSSYIIYFITTVFTVALLFAANNVLFADELWAFDMYFSVRILSTVLTVIIVVVSLVVAFIIAYATAFMFKKRKKEFGTYMLLGINRTSVIQIFVLENLIIGAVSFVVGCLLGVGVFYALNSVFCSIVGNNIQPLTLSLDSLPVTLLLWAIIFVLAVLISGIILAKSSIGELLKGEVAQKKWPRLPIIEMCLALAMFAFIVLDSVYIVQNIRAFAAYELNYLDAIARFPVAAVLLIVAVMVFYLCLRSVYLRKLDYKTVIDFRRKEDVVIELSPDGSSEPDVPSEPSEPSEHTEFARTDSSASHSAVPVDCFMKAQADTVEIRKYRGRTMKGGNVFHYRQMSTAVNRNSAIMGIIAVLVSFAVIATIIVFSLRYVLIDSIDAPFDVTARWYEPLDGSYAPWTVGSPEEVLEEAKKYSEIEFGHIFELYNSDEKHIAYVMAVSDYNALAQRLGDKEYKLADDEYIGTDYSADGQMTLYGKTLKYVQMRDGFAYDILRNFLMTYFLIVPDSVLTLEVRESKVSLRAIAMDTTDFLPTAFHEKFTYRDGSSSGSVLDSIYREIDTINVQYSVVIMSALFLGVTFMLIAMALLSLKVMADADADKKRYAILNMLGADARRQRRLLFRQMFVFFSVPLLIPLLLTVPAIISSLILSGLALGAVPTSVIGICVAVPLVYFAIYVCYFSSTYFLSVKSCITSMEKARVRLLADS